MLTHESPLLGKGKSEIKAIARIKKILADRSHDLRLFTLGIQSNRTAVIYEMEL